MVRRRGNRRRRGRWLYDVAIPTARHRGAAAKPVSSDRREQAFGARTGTRRNGVDPGGEFSMGAQDPHDIHDAVGMQATTDSRPVHRVFVDGFWMDRTEVTNEQFARFVKATGYVTVAERTPRAEDFPGAPTDESRARFSGVFTTSRGTFRSPIRITGGRTSTARAGAIRSARTARSLDRSNFPWCTSRTRTRSPTRSGPASACRPKRSGSLPRAADCRGGSFRGAMSSGTTAAGWPTPIKGTSPITTAARTRSRASRRSRSFRRTATGSHDVAGNVWEWVSDWYRPDYYARLASTGAITRNPQGPADSFDPDEPGEKKRVHRGGSFLCTDQYCSRYMVGTRGKGEIGTGTNHLGFRCVKAQ